MDQVHVNFGIMQQEQQRTPMQKRLARMNGSSSNSIEIQRPSAPLSVEPIGDMKFNDEVVDFAKFDTKVISMPMQRDDNRLLVTLRSTLDIRHITFPKFGQKLNKYILSMYVKDQEEVIMKHVEVESSLCGDNIAYLLQISAYVSPVESPVEIETKCETGNACYVVKFSKNIFIIVFHV
jgi:hypothetical protein